VESQQIVPQSVEGGEASQEPTHPMSELLDQDYARVVPKHGEIIEGIVVSKTPNEVIVDIGCKSEGIVSARDLERLDPAIRKSLRVGDSVYVYVIRPQDASGNSILSLSRAMLEGDWKKAQELFDSEEVFEGVVASTNRGGLIVHVGRVRGFVPASQVSSIRLSRNMDDAQREELLGQLTGKTVHCKIIELDRRRNRLILSERSAMREWRQDRKEQLMSELKEGVVRHGVVSSLCDFGAFVDLGGADGLIHLSELSWSRVAHPRQVLQVGQEVDVFVLGVDRDRRRIALSLKRLKPEPWSDIEQRYQIGQVVKGRITNITDFGAFARLDEDIEGLIHISELSEDRIGHPGEVVQEGQELELRVIRIDAARQRLGLSLRRVTEDQIFEDFDWEEADALTASDETDDLEGEDEDA
jgi:small subunit ribosomal protein S1